MNKTIRRISVFFVTMLFTIIFNYAIKLETGNFASYEFLILFVSINYYGLLNKEEDQI